MLALGMRAAFPFGLLEVARFFLGPRLRGLGVGVDVGLLQVFLDVLLVVARGFVAALAHLLLGPGFAFLGRVAARSGRRLLVVFALGLLLQDSRHGIAGDHCTS